MPPNYVSSENNTRDLTEHNSKETNTTIWDKFSNFIKFNSQNTMFKDRLNKLIFYSQEENIITDYQDIVN